MRLLAPRTLDLHFALLNSNSVVLVVKELARELPSGLNFLILDELAPSGLDLLPVLIDHLHDAVLRKPHEPQRHPRMSTPHHGALEAKLRRLLRRLQAHVPIEKK